MSLAEKTGSLLKTTHKAVTVAGVPSEKRASPAELVQAQELGQTLASLVSEDRETSAIGPAVRDECGRFRVSAENVGAHRADRLSLDYRVNGRGDKLRGFEVSRREKTKTF
jgi:hypothetical protein